MAQEFFVGWEGPQQARAQQQAHVQQANLLAARADAQTAQDNEFDFRARNQLAAEDTQRYQFARQEEAAAANAVQQERAFVANQAQNRVQEARLNAQNRVQEARLNAQGRRDDEKFTFDKGLATFNQDRITRAEDQAKAGSIAMADAFTKSVGHAYTEQGKANDLLKDFQDKEYNRITAEAASSGYVVDKFGNYSFRPGRLDATNPVEIGKLSAFQARANPISAKYNQLQDKADLWVANIFDLEKNGMSKGMYVSGSLDSGVTVQNQHVDRIYQATPARPVPATPAVPVPATPAVPDPRAWIVGGSALDDFVSQFNGMPPNASPGSIRAFKAQVREAVSQGRVTEAGATKLFRDAGIERF